MSEKESVAASQRRTLNRQRFVRVIESRVNKILEGLDNVGKCSNRRNYEYSEADVKRIFGEIERKVRDTKSLFQGSPQSRSRFTLQE